MRTILMLELFFLWCSISLATSTATKTEMINQNCGVYFRNPETKTFNKLGSLEEALHLAPISDFISSKYVTMFSNERLLGQSASHNLVELSILAKNATVSSAIAALEGFLYELHDVLYGVSFFCDAKGAVSIWRIFTSEEFASGIAARIWLIASQNPDSVVKMTYVEKRPFRFELETVETQYWDLFLRTSDGTKCISSFSRTGVESLVDYITRFDSLDYSSFIVAKKDGCFEKFSDSLPRLRLNIPKDLVRSFLCWPIVEDRNDGAVYDVPKNFGLEYLCGISFDPAIENACFVDYFIALDAPDQNIGSIEKFLIGLDAHQRWKTMLIGTKPYELGINLRASLTGKPLVLSHAKGGLSLMEAWRKGLLPADPDKTTFVFEFPAAVPSGIKNVGFTVEVPANPYLKRLLLINTYYNLCHSLFSGFKEFLWKIVIRQVGRDKMQLIWVFSTKTSPGCVVGLESKQIADVMAKFMTFNGFREFCISEVVMNGSTLKSDRQAKIAVHDCSEVLAIFNENYEPRLILPESFAEHHEESKGAAPVEEKMACPSDQPEKENPAQISAETSTSTLELVTDCSTPNEVGQITQVSESNAEVPESNRHLHYILKHGFAGFQIQRPKPEGDCFLEIRFNLEDADSALRAEILHRVLGEMSDIYLLKAGPLAKSSFVQVFLALNNLTLQDAAVFKLKLRSQDPRITGVRILCRRCIPASMMWTRSIGSRLMHRQNFYDKYLVGSNKTGKKLSDIIDMALFSSLNPSEIASIWQEHYLKKPGKTGFSIPEETLKIWRENSLRWPNMIVPLKRSPGSVENYFAQQVDKELGITTLADFQKYGPASQPSIRVQIFDELARLKGLGLLLVHFNESANRDQAEILVKSLIRIYVKQPVWPQTFNERPSEFDYNGFVESQ